MIRVFRKLRADFGREGKTRSYLLYMPWAGSCW
jgi:hypothetical protein